MVGVDHAGGCCYHEHFMYNLYSKFREPKLFRMATKGKWDDIPSRCRSHPKEVTFRHKYPPNDTALHRIVRTGGTRLSSSPAAAARTGTYEDSEGSDRQEQFTCGDGSCTTAAGGTREEGRRTGAGLAAATAIAEEIEEEIAVNEIKYAAVQAILEANRQAATIQDAFGRTPLHLACMNFNAPPPDSLFCSGSKGSCSASGGTAEDNRYDLDVSCSSLSRDYDAELALIILEASPKGAGVVDVEKRTPLHYLVARNGYIPASVLKALVDKFPQATVMPDMVKETPLDIYLRRRREDMEEGLRPGAGELKLIDDGKVEEILSTTAAAIANGTGAAAVIPPPPPTRAF